MTRGVSFGVGAGLLWGLAFVLPDLVPRWSALAVTTGRYLAYGAVSVVVLTVITRRRPGTLETLRRHWRPALVFAATGNVGYYLLLVVGIQAVGAPVATVVVGSTPVVVAAVSNIRERLYAWRRIAPPLILVGVGLATVSGPNVLRPAGSSLAAVLGIAASAGAVALWTIYGIGNATFLRRHREIGGSSWSATVGIFTGLLALALVPMAVLLGPVEAGRGVTGSDIGGIVAVSAVLGCVVSWGGTWSWNEASSRLSTTFAGLLIATETISGYTYSYVLDARLPPSTELLGLGLVVAGVVAVTGIRPRTPSSRTPGTNGFSTRAGADGAAQLGGGCGGTRHAVAGSLDAPRTGGLGDSSESGPRRRPSARDAAPPIRAASKSEVASNRCCT
ncbi:DMT family transporter [Streptomyces sp. NPDC056835]|uniref:DMT family transporter n=1 Tax=Streptomyces sp. NPDC056835 TaxID=3345956 RepID=UPI0036A2CC56